MMKSFQDQLISAYPYSFKFKDKEKTLLWFSSEEGGDKFLVNEFHDIVFADSIELAKKKFNNPKFKIIWDEAALIDFDLFWSDVFFLIKNSDLSEEGYDVVLNGWNFIEDVIRTLDLRELDLKLKVKYLNRFYKKIFYGANIEAVTPKGSGYAPIWDKNELVLFETNISYVWMEIGSKSKLWESSNPLNDKVRR